jgi:hypothetical protein
MKNLVNIDKTPLFILITLFIISVSGKVYAQPASLFDMPEMPDYSADLSEKDFLENTELISELPFDDKYLAYQIRLPYGWEKQQHTFNSAGKKNEVVEENDDDIQKQKVGSDNDISRRILGEIARYYSPSRIYSRSRIVIKATALDHDISAQSWFISYVLQNGYTLKGLNVISDKRVEGAYITLNKDQSYLVRVIAEINGPRMVIINYYLPDKYFEEERAWQQRILHSFKFIQPEKAVVELKRTYSFLDLLQFDYPSSWRLHAPNIYSIDGMDAKLINTRNEQTLTGEISISVVSTDLDTSIGEEIGYAIEELNNKGLTIGDLIAEIKDYQFHDHIYYSKVEVYEAIDKQERFLDHEFWLTILVEDRYYYFIYMLTPGKDIDFYKWAGNVGAFKTVIESMRI